MMTTMLFSSVVVYLPAWYALRGLGNDGLWLAFLLFNGARGAALAFSFRSIGRRGQWLQGPEPETGLQAGT